jgi:hypothetical protein
MLLLSYEKEAKRLLFPARINIGARWLRFGAALLAVKKQTASRGGKRPCIPLARL